MRQKFNTQTIQSAFIKSILNDIPLPTYNTVSTGDYIVKGCIYLYKCNLIRCKISGYIGFNAFYEIIKHYDLGTYEAKWTNSYLSPNLYYDSELHEKLGHLLRVIRDVNDINLMPLYNCFSYRFLSNISITKTIYGSNVHYRVEPETNQFVKIAQIPIKFNKKYTIAIDCDTEVIISPAILSYQKLIPSIDIEDSTLTDELNEINPIQRFDSLSYTNPILFEVSNKIENTAKKWNMYEKDLFLLIQLPANNSSSITVIEGDYTSIPKKVTISAEDISSIDPTYLNEILINKLSLLRLNDGVTYPFSDRLIEYLLENVITDRDSIGQNIKNVQQKLGIVIDGAWTNLIRYKLYNQYVQTDNNIEPDIMGFVDKDVEKFLRRW